MMEFTNPVSITGPSTPDLSDSDDDDEKDDIVLPPSGKEDANYEINVINEQLLQPIQLTPYNVQTYYSKVGVSILPEIPEEMENEEMYDAMDKINSRRISKISTRLEKINQLSKKASEEEYNAKNMQRGLLLNTEEDHMEQNISREILDVNALESIKASEELVTENGDQKQHTYYSNKEDKVVENLDINTLVSNKTLEEPERIQNIEYIHNYGKNKSRLFKEFRTTRSGYCCGCSPYRKFIWRRRYRTIADFFIDNILKPLWISLKDLHYYPTVLSKVMTTITATMCFTLTPYIALEKNSSFQPEDATILLSYVAFSWCLFLVLLPLVINFSKAKFRATFICGLLLTGTCMIRKYTILSKFNQLNHFPRTMMNGNCIYFNNTICKRHTTYLYKNLDMYLFDNFITVISKKMTNDIMTISCLLFGFGYGIISYTENMVYRSFLGARKWDMIQGTLETTTAVFVILTYYIIYHYNLDLTLLLLVALISYYANAILWTVAPILKDIIIFISKYYCTNEDQQIM